MILALRPALQHAQRAAGVERRCGHQFEQHSFADMVRARATRQNAAGSQQPQRAQVDFLVTGGRAVQAAARLSERRRIQNHHRELAPRRGVTGQQIE